jgi:hypothetical protein
MLKNLCLWKVSVHLSVGLGWITGEWCSVDIWDVRLFQNRCIDYGLGRSSDGGKVFVFS